MERVKIAGGAKVGEGARPIPELQADLGPQKQGVGTCGGTKAAAPVDVPEARPPLLRCESGDSALLKFTQVREAVIGHNTTKVYLHQIGRI